jgi:hypothetical protein
VLEVIESEQLLVGTRNRETSFVVEIRWLFSLWAASNRRNLVEFVDIGRLVLVHQVHTSMWMSNDHGRAGGIGQ